MKETLREIEKWLKEKEAVNGKFIMGQKNPSMVDIFLYPILERVILLKDSSWNDTYEKLKIEILAP